MSLSNLLTTMLLLGPLVNWWDGGGKGERFIQLIKPFLKRGVREDVQNFFGTLIEKLYQMRQLELFEDQCAQREAQTEDEVSLSVSFC